MRTWNDYKEHIKTVDTEGKSIIEEMEGIADIVGTIVSRRNEMGISQRELAYKTGLSQSTIARIESFKITPNIDTLLILLHNLGLKLKISGS